MRRALSSSIAALATLVLATTAAAAPITPPPLGSFGQGAGETPLPLEDVGIEQRLGEQLPLDAVFRNESGAEVRLGDYFGKKPIVLALAYYECPMLCTLVLNGMVKGLRPVAFTAGDEYDVVTISIDPSETPELAKAKKEAYVDSYARAGKSDGFHFLTGSEESIRAVADALGYRFRYLSETDEFAHAAAIYVVTPEGRISHYFFGVEFSARDIRLALVEAAEGKIGNLVDELMLFCFRYDPTAGKYSAEILAMVRLGGVATVLWIVGFIAVSRWRETRRPPIRS